jgi:hypothetical protein
MASRAPVDTVGGPRRNRRGEVTRCYPQPRAEAIGISGGKRGRDHFFALFFLPPPVSLFTVAHARDLAVFAETPRFSYPFSMWDAWRFCLFV